MGKQRAHHSSHKRKDKKVDKTTKPCRSSCHEGYLKNIEGVVQTKLESLVSAKKIDRKMRMELERYPLLAKAVFLGCERVVDSILEAGESVNIQVQDGRTPLIIAVENGYMGIVQKLLKKGADPKLLRQDGRNALMIAVSKNDSRTFTLLWNSWNKSNFCELNHADSQGYTVLTIAVEHGYSHITKFLLNLNGIKVDKQTKDGKTPLMFAVTRGQFTIVKRLLSCGADFSLEDKDGATAICLAISQNKTDIIDILLECFESKSRDTYVKKRIELLTRPRAEDNLSTISFYKVILFRVLLEIKRYFEDGVVLLEKYKVFPSLYKCLDAHQQDTELLRIGFHLAACLIYDKVENSSYIAEELAEQYINAKFADFSLKVMQNYRLKSMTDLRGAAFLSIHASTLCLSGKMWLKTNYCQIFDFNKEFKTIIPAMTFWAEEESTKAKIIYDQFLKNLIQVEKSFKETGELKACASENNSFQEETFNDSSFSTSEVSLASNASDNQQWSLVPNSKSVPNKVSTKNHNKLLPNSNAKREGKKTKGSKLQNKLQRKFAEKKLSQRPNLKYVPGLKGCFPALPSEINLSETGYADALKKNLQNGSTSEDGISKPKDLMMDTNKFFNNNAKEFPEIAASKNIKKENPDAVGKNVETTKEEQKVEMYTSYDMWNNSSIFGNSTSIMPFLMNLLQSEGSKNKPVDHESSNNTENLTTEIKRENCAPNECSEDKQNIQKVFAALGIKIPSDHSPKSKTECKRNNKNENLPNIKTSGNNEHKNIESKKPKISENHQTVNHTTKRSEDIKNIKNVILKNIETKILEKDKFYTKNHNESEKKDIKTSGNNEYKNIESKKSEILKNNQTLNHTNKRSEDIKNIKNVILKNIEIKIIEKDKFYSKEHNELEERDIKTSGNNGYKNTENKKAENLRKNQTKNQTNKKLQLTKNIKDVRLKNNEIKIIKKDKSNTKEHDELKEREINASKNRKFEEVQITVIKKPVISTENGGRENKLHGKENDEKRNTVVGNAELKWRVVSNNRKTSTNIDITDNHLKKIIPAVESKENNPNIRHSTSVITNEKEITIDLNEDNKVDNTVKSCPLSGTKSSSSCNENNVPQPCTTRSGKNAQSDQSTSISVKRKYTDDCFYEFSRGYNEDEVKVFIKKVSKSDVIGTQSFKRLTTQSTRNLKSYFNETKDIKLNDDTDRQETKDSTVLHKKLCLIYSNLQSKPKGNKSKNSIDSHYLSLDKLYFNTVSSDKIEPKVEESMLLSITNSNEASAEQCNLFCLVNNDKQTTKYQLLRLHLPIKVIDVVSGIKLSNFHKLTLIYQRIILNKILSQLQMYFLVSSIHQRLYGTSTIYSLANTNSKEYHDFNRAQTLGCTKNSSKVPENYSIMARFKSEFKKFMSAIFFYSDSKSRNQSRSLKTMDHKRKRQCHLSAKQNNYEDKVFINNNVHGFKPQFINCEPRSQWYKILNGIESCIPLGSFLLSFQDLKSFFTKSKLHELVCSTGSIVFSSKEEHILRRDAYGTYVGLMKNGNPVVVREFEMSSNEIVKLLSKKRSLSHKKIAQFYCVCHSPLDQKIFAITELIEFSLPEYLKTKTTNFDEKHLVKDLIDAIQYLHGKRIVHGFLKPSNVMVTIDHRLKVTGFYQMDVTPLLYGTVRSPNKATIGYALSSFCWRPYELIVASNEIEARESLTTASDIQVAGMLIYYILSGGKHPFGSTDQSCQNNILSGLPEFGPKPSDVESGDLVIDMIKKTPSSRLTINRVAKHPYLWNVEKRFQFLVAVARKIDFYVQKPTKISEALQDSCIEARDWTYYIHPKLLKYVSKEMNKTYLNDYANLLHFVTSITDNFEIMPSQMKSYIGQPSLFISRTFPTIFMSIYCVVRDNPCAQRQMALQPYF